MKTVRELIPLLIQTEEAFSRLYNNIASIDGQYNPKVKTAASVLARQEGEHAKFYRSIMESEEYDINVEVDDSVFEHARRSLFDFKDSIMYEGHSSTDELLKYAIAYERTNEDVLRKIKGSLEKTEGNESLITLFNNLISAECQHSSTLEGFIKK